jgi:hypothetical protein
VARTTGAREEGVTKEENTRRWRRGGEHEGDNAGLRGVLIAYSWRRR